MINRRHFSMAGLGAAAVLAGVRGSAALSPEPLGAIAARKGLLFGSAVMARQLRDQPAFKALVERECTVIVAENEMKWRWLEPQRGRYDWAAPDWLADFCVQQRKTLRGHTLVWHESLPDWARKEIALGRKEAETLMIGHIRTVMGHFKGKIRDWDVVNEAIDPAHRRPDGLRISPYLEALGPEYLDIAFHAAREADPAARLIYNEFGFEQEAGWQLARRSALLKLLEGFRKRGVPCDSLGIQAHLHGHESYSSRSFAEFLTRISDMGYAISVTELDVGDHRLIADIPRRDELVADLTRRFLDVVLANPKTDAVLTWGLADHMSWLNSAWATQNMPQRIRPDGLPQRPLPYDDKFAPKPMREAIAVALAGASPR